MAPNGEAQVHQIWTHTHLSKGTAAMNFTNDKVRHTIQTTSAMFVSVVATLLTTVLFLS